MAVSDIEARAIKTELAEAEEEVKIWRSLVFATLEDAVNFVNLEPAQGAGEFVFSNRSDGQVDAAYYL
ncbi:hypothetical protein ABZ543_08255 [Streptomyces roseifaciens]